MKMTPFDALNRRRCQTPLYWTHLDKALILGPDLIQETTETIMKIQEHIRIAQIRQKSYADKRGRPLEFNIGDKVFLKVSPTKGIKRFRVRGKLSRRYIEPYEIIDRINLVAYQQDLPVDLEHLHNVFHVS